MMECVCKRCGYTTNRTSNIKNHLKRKNQCSDDKNCGISCELLLKEFEKDKSTFEFKCKFCNLQFKTSQGLNYHKRNGCKEHNSENNDSKNKDNEFEKDKKIKELEEELNKLRHVINNYGTINNTTNITNNITIVYDFGKEEIEYIKDNPDFLKECLVDIPIGLRKVVKKIYFDKDHPENHTIAMKNLKLNQVMVREDGQWIQRNVHETIPKMVKKGKRLLHEHYCNDNSHISESHNELDPKLSYFNDLSIPTTSAYKTAVSMVKSEISNYNFKDIKK